MLALLRRTLFLTVLVLMIASLGGVAAQDAVKWTPVTDERLLNAAKDPNNWLQYYRTQDGWSYSPLSQINARTVKRLQIKWMKSLGELGEQQGFPMVNDGVMIVTVANIPHNTV